MENLRTVLEYLTGSLISPISQRSDQAFTHVDVLLPSGSRRTLKVDRQFLRRPPNVIREQFRKHNVAGLLQVSTAALPCIEIVEVRSRG